MKRLILAGMALIGVFAALGALADNGRARINPNPGFLIGRSGGGRAGRLTMSGVQSGPAFALFSDFNFAQQPQMPTCTGDAHCVFQCLVKADGSSGHCVDNTGADLTGYTEGVGATFATSYMQGVFAWSDLNDTSSATAVPHISNAAIRAMFGGDHTIVFLGSPGVKADATPWFGMITDGTNQLQVRYNGSSLQCLESPPGLSSDSNMPLEGYEMFGCTRTSGSLVARTKGGNSLGAPITSTMAVVTGSNALYLWGGVGGCCTPGGSASGQLLSITGYNEGKSATWWAAAEKAAWGATGIQSGGLGSAGTVGTTPAGRDDVLDSGFVHFFRDGAYICDPTYGCRSQNLMQNFWAVDPLAAATWIAIGTPTTTSNVASGPFSQRKNLPEGDLIVDDDGANFEGYRSLSVLASTDAGFTTSGAGWVNASCYASQGTSGTTRDSMRIRINTDGALDAGALLCDVTGIGATPARYPSGGCAAFVSGSKVVTADVLVGTSAAQTGSITTYQCQVTQTLELESPTVDGLGRGASWLELDGGGVASGVAQGKIEAIFSTLYSSSTVGADQTAEKAASAYVFDAYNATASHDALLWTASTGSPSEDGGLGESSLDSLLYGISGHDENKFGQGNPWWTASPVTYVAGRLYVASVEWVPAGAMFDGGSGCRATTRLDVCADPTTCHASSIRSQNTGTPGECPLSADLIDLGTRIAGSSPSSIWVREVRVFH